jgi:hypothetical protein
MTQVHDASSDDTLLNVVKKMNFYSYADEHKRLLDWLHEHEQFKDAGALDFSKAITTVERFIFRSRFRK